MEDVRSDKQIVEELKQGNQASLEVLINRYGTKVYSLAMRFTRCPEDAEEVLQDVFLTVCRKINSFEGKSAFSSWLFRVTVNS
ncbi:MAG: sigma-70 family RNA polymerase sigma factor, partial [Bdellovibrionales bacterium]|nr:sigma-70 family RNA polymerase sigma factor [Bdellovibrionales bacterium]